MILLGLLAFVVIAGIFIWKGSGSKVEQPPPLPQESGETQLPDMPHEMEREMPPQQTELPDQTVSGDPTMFQEQQGHMQYQDPNQSSGGYTMLGA